MRHTLDVDHRHWMVDSFRSFGIGMAHGLVGSGALLLMILTATSDVSAGLWSMVLFGNGSILSMVVIGGLIIIPVIFSRSVGHRLFMGVQGLVSMASVAVGVWMLVK